VAKSRKWQNKWSSIPWRFSSGVTKQHA